MIVLITHFNDHKGLKKSLYSISQHSDIDVLIVDDGSDVVPSGSDFEIKNLEVLALDKNYGIEEALNKGLEYILSKNKYKYIARLDCGDTIHSDRFRIQYDFMEKNPDIHLLGSHVDFEDKNGKKLYTYKVPTEHKDIQHKMFLKNSFIHPSVVIRIETIKKVGLYPKHYKYAEDYAYFFTIIKKFKTANIDKVLTTCQSNENGISISNRKKQIRSKIRIILNNFDFGIYSFLGFFRNLSLILLPNSLNMKLKKIYYR